MIRRLNISEEAFVTKVTKTAVQYITITPDILKLILVI